MSGTMKKAVSLRADIFFAPLLAIITIGVVVAFYLNHPRAELLSDTYSYFYVVERIQTYHQLVTFWRLPGYPLFIDLIYTLFGQGNALNVSIVQGVLFILVTLEIYCIARLVTRQAWIAFICGLCTGTNINILSFIKPLMTEALAIFLFTSLALALVIFMLTLRRRVFWIACLWMFLLCFTRPEWIYVPGLVFVLLIFFAMRRKQFKRILPHAIIALVLIYGAIGGYVAINRSQNGLTGITWIQNLNALGKVMQYGMQDEAPPQYATVTTFVHQRMAKGITDPYLLLDSPIVSNDYSTQAGKYADAIIIEHPIEFISKTLPLFISYPLSYHKESYAVENGRFSHSLTELQNGWAVLQPVNIIFPLCAIIWLFFLCWKGTRSLPSIQAIGVLTIIVLCAIGATTFGTYRSLDYSRIQVLFEPALIMIILFTFLYTPLVFMQLRQKASAKTIDQLDTATSIAAIR